MKKRIIIFSLIAMFVLVVFSAVEQSVMGSVLAKLEREHQELSVRNRDLSDELIKNSSLSKVSESSIELGMIKPENVVYLTSEAAPVAKAQ